MPSRKFRQRKGRQKATLASSLVAHEGASAMDGVVIEAPPPSEPIKAEPITEPVRHIFAPGDVAAMAAATLSGIPPPQFEPKHVIGGKHDRLSSQARARRRKRQERAISVTERLEARMEKEKAR